MAIWFGPGRASCGCIYYLLPPDKDYLSNKYNIPVERINAASKPHGCAYNDAPLGNKNCHYDKHVYGTTKTYRSSR